jgi:hypothetical protein
MNVRQNARLTSQGRAQLIQTGRTRRARPRGGPRGGRDRSHGPEVGRPLARRADPGLGGSVLAARALPPRHAPGRHCPDRRVAPPALDRGPDRRVGGRQPATVDRLHVDTKKLGRILRPGHPSPGTAGGNPAGPDGSTRTSGSMMPRAWPMSRCCPMSGAARRRAFSAAPYAG